MPINWPVCSKCDKVCRYLKYHHDVQLCNKCKIIYNKEEKLKAKQQAKQLKANQQEEQLKANHIEEWIANYIVNSPNKKVKTSDAHKHYLNSEFCEVKLSAESFSKMMSFNKFERKKVGGIFYYKDIEFKNPQGKIEHHKN
jgi:hypothetical protein